MPEITNQWTMPTEDINGLSLATHPVTGFSLERADHNGTLFDSFQPIIDTDANTLRYVDATVSSGLRCKYRYRATNFDPSKPGTGPGEWDESDEIIVSGTNPSSPPGIPTIGIATAGNGQASVPFTPASGGNAAADFTAIAYIGTDPTPITVTGGSSPIVVTGLTNGQAYSFAVKANGSNGASSTYSTRSNVVTPTAPVVLGKTDDFNRASSTTLGTLADGTPWVEQVGNMMITTDGKLGLASGNEGRAVFNTGKVNHKVTSTCDGVRMTDANYWRIGVAIVDANNLYELEFGANGDLFFRSKVNGTFSANLVSGASVIGAGANGAVFAVERINGNQFIIYKNGVELARTNNTQTLFPNATIGGVGVGQYNASGVKATHDNVRAD